jgi:DNA-binding MurR/RpiR family transcriptional regulator
MTTEAWLAGRVEGSVLGAQAERVVQVLSRTPQFAGYSSAREVAERAGVNVSTVIRTAQHLGFEGWPDLRRELRAIYLGSLGSDDAAGGSATDPAARVIRQDAANLAALSTAENLAAIRATAEAIRTAGRTVVLTSGSGIGPAHVLVYLGSVLGYDIRLAAGSSTAQAVDVSRLAEGDCLVTLNVWRLTRTLRSLTRIGRSRGATVSVLTDLRSSPLVEDAHHVVLTPIEGVRAAPSLTAMVAAVQAILGELTDGAAARASGEVQRVWHDLDLMDDQP